MLQDDASRATALEMESKRRELYQWIFPLRNQHKWLLRPAVRKQNEGGWWVSKRGGIACNEASPYGAAPTRFVTVVAPPHGLVAQVGLEGGARKTKLATAALC